MNTQNHDDLEQLLGLELHDRAGHVHGAPLGLADVKGRAGRIRRNRRIAGGVVAAAVFALAVPVGLNVADSVRPDSSPPVAPSPSPEPTPTPQADGSFRLTLEGLPQGEPAAVAYTRIGESQLVTPDRTYDTPESYPQIVEYGDGWLALRSGDFGNDTGHEVAVLTEDFDVVSSVTSGPGLALTPDGSRVAWVEVDAGRSAVVVASTADGEELWRNAGPEGDVKPVGFLAQDSVVLAVTESNGSQSGAVVGPDEIPMGFGAFLNLYDASPVNGLVAGQTDYRADGTSCAGVTDPMPIEPNGWETCDHTLGDFSPDGGYVIALASQYDGPGSPTVSVLEAGTGKPVVDFRPDRDVLTGVDQAVWEDRDTFLATVTQGQDQALLRFELNGRVELVDGPFRTGGMDVNLWLSTYTRG